MDNKRKGSSPSSPPKQSGGLAWDEPSAHERSMFDLTDDDDGPLPAPPDFDGNADRIPDLLDGDEMILDDAEELVEDAELLDSALVTELRPGHRIPPPIPAPVPTGGGARSFIDDGEIALPPRIARYVQNFPFRRVRAEDDVGAEDTLDDDANPDTHGWRSAALSGEIADDDDDADELEPDDLVAEDELEVDAEAPTAETPTSAAPPRPLARDALPLVAEDDERAPSFAEDPTLLAPTTPPRTTPADDDDAPLFVDADAEPAPLTRARPAETGSRWSFADLDARQRDRKSVV